LNVPLDALLATVAPLRLRDQTDELALVLIAIEADARVEDVVTGNLGLNDCAAGQRQHDGSKDAKGYLGESLSHYGTPVR
jgi:hypothetical protein